MAVGNIPIVTLTPPTGRFIITLLIDQNELTSQSTNLYLKEYEQYV